jgi:hypothetical protein
LWVIGGRGCGRSATGLLLPGSALAFGEMFSLTALCLPIILFDVCFVYRAGFFLKMHKPRKAKLGFSHVRLVAAAVT